MKKGFTLIELLAVIVIIAVIALITIPLIGKVIENSKKGALTASASGIIEAAEIYYSTKMMENPETKTFTCSNEGCLSGEEKLDYKGQVSEGRVILYSDGKVSICIEDGTNAALKLAEQSEITTEEGSCNYDNEDYSIDATVSKAKYNELQEELKNGKKVIATAITNKGVETSEDNTFEQMATNIDSISVGDLDQSKLYGALQYSGLVTKDMTVDEMLEVLATEYPSSKTLYELGNENESVTGGFTSYASLPSTYATSSSGVTVAAPILTKNASSMELRFPYTPSMVMGTVFAEKLIDFKDIDALLLDFSMTGGYGGPSINFILSTTKENGFTPITTLHSVTATVFDGKVLVDVSEIEGKYYFGMVLFNEHETSDTVAVIRKIKPIVGNLTANKIDSVIASSTLSGYPVENIFDNDNSSFWHSSGASGTGVGEWIQFNFDDPVCVKQVSIVQRNTSSHHPVAGFELQASNNITDGWTTLGNFTNANTSLGGVNIHNINNEESFTYYRVLATTGNGTAYIDIAEITMYDDIVL